jgi:hypothetical protein
VLTSNLTFEIKLDGSLARTARASEPCTLSRATLCRKHHRPFATIGLKTRWSLANARQRSGHHPFVLVARLASLKLVLLDRLLGKLRYLFRAVCRLSLEATPIGRRLSGHEVGAKAQARALKVSRQQWASWKTLGLKPSFLSDLNS